MGWAAVSCQAVAVRCQLPHLMLTIPLQQGSGAARRYDALRLLWYHPAAGKLLTTRPACYKAQAEALAILGWYPAACRKKLSSL